MTTTTAFAVHKTTGLPIEEYPTFEVGDLVTESINSDGYPGVVVHVTPKRVYVRGVNFVGNFKADDAPGWNGYGDSGSIAVDPESVTEALALGPDGASKYVLYVSPHVSGFRHPGGGSFNEQDKYGEAGFHRSRWRKPGGYGSLSKGARYRQDPHF